MLIARPLPVPAPRLFVRVKGRDVQGKCAFPQSTVLTFLLRVPRALGARGAVLRLYREQEAICDLAFAFREGEGAWDRYALRLPLFEISAKRGGIFYYEILFLRGNDTLFGGPGEGGGIKLSASSAARFFLLVHKDALATPRRFWGRTMYQIFPDRFAPGGGARRADACYHRTWYEEIEQYAATPGAYVENNEFFGGTLWGVREKLPYLKSLGVGVIYLCPIFRAYSNHKYDTADYEEVDLQFGGESALRALLDECKKNDIIVILDGVFNHTGDHSRYFERRGHYGAKGAYLSPASPYADWYRFTRFPTEYEAWWGIPILPRLQLQNPAVRSYFLGEDGILARYMRMGVGGWRLDVADELPDAFLDELRSRVKEESAQTGLVLGEVWENAATKIAYGTRRRYLWGDQLDGVMNYPLRAGLVAFARDGDARTLCRVLRELWSHYPTPVCHALMNLLSTHDTARILTVLGTKEVREHSAAELREMRLTPAERAEAKKRLLLAAALQYTVFGMPCLFYGDEAGMEGYGDPFCRRPYPWGREDAEILAFYRKLGAIRCENSAFCDGDFRLLCESDHALAFSRKNAENHIVVAANRGAEPFLVHLCADSVELLTEKVEKRGKIGVPRDTVRIWRIKNGTVQKNLGKVVQKQKPKKQELPL